MNSNNTTVTCTSCTHTHTARAQYRGCDSSTPCQETFTASPGTVIFLTLMLSMLMVVVLDNFKKSDAHCYIVQRPGFQAD